MCDWLKTEVDVVNAEKLGSHFQFLVKYEISWPEDLILVYVLRVMKNFLSFAEYPTSLIVSVDELEFPIKTLSEGFTLNN